MTAPTQERPVEGGSDVSGRDQSGRHMTGDELSGSDLSGGDLSGVILLAVVLARSGQLGADAVEAISEAGGTVLVLGDGAQAAAGELTCAAQVWWHDTGAGFAPARLSALIAPLVAGADLIVLPGTPDGRDLAPRLAAALDRPLLAHAACVWRVDSGRGQAVAGTPGGRPGGGVRAELCRLDDRVVIPVEVDGPAVVTMAIGAGVRIDRAATPSVRELRLPELDDVPGTDVKVIEVIEPDPSTMDLADARLVLAGGAGLAAGLDRDEARSTFELLAAVATALGASAGATRVASDAGWIGYDRQSGTTGVTIDPSLYVAFGISGATQHSGGLGHPDHVVSINTDPFSPMTAMADLGVVADARAVLIELAVALGVAVPAGLRAQVTNAQVTNAQVNHE